MPLQLVRNDITHMQADAIVNAANHSLLGGGGVDGAIHRAAGPELRRACENLGGCKTGEAKITPGFCLPCRYVIHTVGPVWKGGIAGEREQLAACYRNALALARRYGCRSVAFPLISAGAYGYPQERAMRTAVETISAFLLECEEDLDVSLVIFGGETVEVGRKLFRDIRQFIDDHYVEMHADPRRSMQRAEVAAAYADVSFESSAVYGDTYDGDCYASLAQELERLDESFSEMVLRRIREKGMKNAECYKKANLDKKHFSKIVNDLHYKPKKTTALALAVALEMDETETDELLRKAGLALSRSEKFDVIVEYFIRNGRYDIFEINEALFYYDQPLLGAVTA